MSRSSAISRFDEPFDALLKKEISRLAVKLRPLSAIRLVSVIQSVIEKLSQKFSPKMTTEQDQEDNLDGFGYANRKSVVIILAAICDKFNIPYSRGEHAYMALTGQILPIKAEVKWSERTGEDKKLNPLQFQDKYWGRYIENNLLFQVDLRALDPSLFEAVRIYVRHNEKGKKPGDFLPPPHISRITRSPENMVDFTKELREALGNGVITNNHKLANLG